MSQSEISEEEIKNWTPDKWAQHKPTERAVKTWTSRTQQTYVIACVTCDSPWPCGAYVLAELATDLAKSYHGLSMETYDLCDQVRLQADRIGYKEALK